MNRYVLASVALSILLVSISYAADKNGKYAIKGVGNSSCANFLVLSEKTSLDKFLYAGWLNGYLTAQNQHLKNTFDLSSWETIHTLGGYLGKYCKDNPKNSFYIAVASMTNALLEKRLQTFSPVEKIGVGTNAIRIYQVSLAQAQTKLKELGFYKGKIDGKNTRETQAALKIFQKEHQLPKTGVPDQKTMHALLVEQ